MSKYGLVKTVKTYRCYWCEREEEVVNGPEDWQHQPSGWSTTCYSHNRPDLCSSDCKAEHQAARSAAWSSCVALHGLPESGARVSGLQEELDRLKYLAAQERREKFL